MNICIDTTTIERSSQRRPELAVDTQRSRTGFWILIGVLAVSGVSMAFIAIFGMFDTIAYSMVWRVFVADVYLIAALAAQHNWLRWCAWIGTGVTFLIGMANVFWEFTPADRWDDRFVYGDPSSGWNPWWGIENDVEVAAHLALGTILLLGFISLAYRWIANERLLRLVYVFMFVMGILSVLLGVFLVLDTPHRWNAPSWLGQLNAGLIILALTGAAIVIIAAFVQRKAVRARDAAAVATESHLSPVDADVRFAAPNEAASAAGMSPEELRALVRQYVDEYLEERQR